MVSVKNLVIECRLIKGLNNMEEIFYSYAEMQLLSNTKELYKSPTRNNQTKELSDYLPVILEPH